MLAVFIYVHSLRWTVPCFVIMGVTPLYMTFWSVLRTITAPFPQKVYRIGDDVMFSQYMRLILFFFHTYVNPKVSIFICDRKKDIQQTSNFNILENRKIQVVEMARSSLQNITTYSLEHGLKATYICMTYTLDLWSCYLSNMEPVIDGASPIMKFSEDMRLSLEVSEDATVFLFVLTEKIQCPFKWHNPLRSCNKVVIGQITKFCKQ